MAHHTLVEKQLNPSKRLLNVLNARWKPPLLWDILREIRAEVITLEAQIADLLIINRELVHEANKDEEDVFIPF